MTLPAPIQSTARRLRDGLDQALHGYRRRELLARLRDTPPRSILFVCNGNICRSPFAAVLAHQQLVARGGNGIAIASAGIINPGRPSPGEAVGAAQALGVPLTAHRSQLLTPALVTSADLVFVMDRWQRSHVCATYRRSARDVLLLGDLDPQWERRVIADPVDQPRAVFDACYARIVRCIDTLVSAIAAGRGAPPQR